MIAEVTENNELVLRWLGDRRNEIKWTACSDTEFEVSARLWFSSGMNFQGTTTIEFSTACYASALKWFASALEQLVEHNHIQAMYSGSGDMHLTILSRRGQA